MGNPLNPAVGVYFGEEYWEYDERRMDAWRKCVRGFVGKCGYLPHAVAHKMAAKVKVRVPERLADAIKIMASDMTRRNREYGVDNFLVTVSALCRKFLSTRYAVYCYPPLPPEEIWESESVDEFRHLVRHYLTYTTSWQDKRRKKQPNTEPEGSSTVEIYFYTTPQFKEKLRALAKQLKMGMGEILAFCATFKVNLVDIEEWLRHRFNLKYPHPFLKPYLEFVAKLVNTAGVEDGRAFVPPEAYDNEDNSYLPAGEGRKWAKAIERISHVSGSGTVNSQRGAPASPSQPPSSQNSSQQNQSANNDYSGYSDFRFVRVLSKSEYEIYTIEEGKKIVDEWRAFCERCGNERLGIYLTRVAECHTFIYAHYYMFSSIPKKKLEQCPYCGNHFPPEMKLPPNCWLCQRCLAIFTCTQVENHVPVSMDAIRKAFDPLYIPDITDEEAEQLTGADFLTSPPPSIWETQRDEEWEEIMNEILSDESVLHMEQVPQYVEKVKEAARAIKDLNILPQIIQCPPFLMCVLSDVLIRAGLGHLLNLPAEPTDYDSPFGAIVQAEMMRRRTPDVDPKYFIPYVLGELARHHPAAEKWLARNFAVTAAMLGVPIDLHYAKFNQLKSEVTTELGARVKELPQGLTFHCEPLTNDETELAFALVTRNAQGAIKDIICIPLKLHHPVFVEVNNTIYMPVEMQDVNFVREYLPSFVKVARLSDIINMAMSVASAKANEWLQSQQEGK